MLLCRRLDVLSPVVLFTLCVFIGYVAPVPAFLAGIDPVSTTWTNVYGDFERSLARALWVTVLGVIGFYLGYGGVRDLLPATRLSDAADYFRPWRRKKLQSVSFIYTVGGLGLFAVGVAIIGGPQTLMVGLSDRVSLFAGLNYLVSAINLLLVVSLVWWVRALCEERLPRPAFWLYTTCALALAAFQGSKAVLFVFTLTMLIVYHTLRRRVPLARLALLGLLFPLFMAVYAIFVREYVVWGEIRSIEAGDSWPLFLWLLATTEFAGNFVQLQALTLVIDRVPDVLDFQGGRTLLAMLSLPVPSAVYPDKYLTAPGVFTLAIDADRWLVGGTTLPPGLIGEMYMNFGAAGVVFGLTMVGGAFGWMRRLMKERGRDPVIVTLHALVVAMMAHYIRGDLVSPTVLLLIFGLPTLVMLRLGLGRRRRPDTNRNERVIGRAVAEPAP
jgi:hypothetical protein